MCSYLLRSYLKCWNVANLAVHRTGVTRDFSVFPNMFNSIQVTVTCLSCPVPWDAVFFHPKWQKLSFLFSPGKGGGRGEGFSTILPVVHADGNDLRQAVSTQEKPRVVWIALRQIVQGVADGRCGFTDNIRRRDRLRKYWDQIRQNFSSYKSEESQAIPLLTGADLPRRPTGPYSSPYHLSGAVCSHNRVMVSYLHRIPMI